jgi:hypothetical protein
VCSMEIGPVRRRFTAEPVASPVPGEASPEVLATGVLSAVTEPSATERAPQADVVVTPAPDRSR